MRFNTVTDNTRYELPDGKAIVFGKETYEIPEMLFSTRENGTLLTNSNNIQRMILQVVEKIGLDKRKEMMGNIYLAGGTSNLKNIINRLQREINEILINSLSASKIKCW